MAGVTITCFEGPSEEGEPRVKNIPVTTFVPSHNTFAGHYRSVKPFNRSTGELCGAVPRETPRLSEGPVAGREKRRRRPGQPILSGLAMERLRDAPHKGPEEFRSQEIVRTSSSRTYDVSESKGYSENLAISSIFAKSSKPLA